MVDAGYLVRQHANGRFDACPAAIARCHHPTRLPHFRDGCGRKLKSPGTTSTSAHDQRAGGPCGGNWIAQTPPVKSQGNRKAQTSGTSAPLPKKIAAQPLEKLFVLLCGIWIGLSLLKFGNPVIFDKMIGPPQDWAEFVFTPWPIWWGYAL